MFCTGSADGCELLGKVFPSTVEAHGSIVCRGSLRSGEILNAYSIKIDLLNSLAILAFEVLDDITDAGAHRLLQLWFVARGRFGSEGILSLCPCGLPSIAVCNGIAENAVKPCDGALVIPYLSCVLHRLDVGGLQNIFGKGRVHS